MVALKSEEQLRQFENSPATKDAQAIAGEYVLHGHDEMMALFNATVKQKKLTTIEQVMLSDRIKNFLMNNGIILRRVA